MDSPDSESRQLMCQAVKSAHDGCSTSRKWKRGGVERFQQSFGLSMTLAEATEAFDDHVLDRTEEVKVRPGNYGDPVYSAIVETPEGQCYFGFTLDRDPDDPQIVIESAHRPTFPRKR